MKPRIHTFRLQAEVTEAQRAYYEEWGFIKFGGVFSDAEVQAMRGDALDLQRCTLAHEIPSADVDDLAPRSEAEDGTVLLHRLPYFTRYSPRTEELLNRPDVLAIGRDLVGVNAWLLNDTMNGVVWQMKRGGKGSAYSEIRWHLDFPEEHMLSPVVSAGVYLDDSTERNGCLAVIPASHRFPPGRYPPPLLIEASAGDVICHAYNILHGSGPALVESDSRATLYLYFCGGRYPGKDLPFATRETKEETKKLFVGTDSK